MTGVFTWPFLLRYSWNANRTCHYESNHCHSCWMCSARPGKAFFKELQRPCCRGWPETQHSAAEHRGAHRKQDQGCRAASLQEQGIHHRPTGERTTADKLVIPNFSQAGSVLSRNHGLATFVHYWWSLVNQSPEQSETEWLCVDVAGHNVINVYKPTRSRLTPKAIPTLPHLSLYVGDFNCQHVEWGYSKTSSGGESLGFWATANNLWLLYDPKGAASFSSHRRNVGTKPDLAFASVSQNNQLLDRRVLGKFPRSQHRPSLITPHKFKVSAYSDSVKALEISQGWLEALLPSHRWIRWEVATSGHNKHRRHTKNFARACCLQLSNTSKDVVLTRKVWERTKKTAILKQHSFQSKKMWERRSHVFPPTTPLNTSHVAVARTVCHAGSTNARPFVVSSFEPRRGLTPLEPLCPYFLGLNRRSRSDGKNMQIPSNSRTPVARRGAPSTTSLEGLGAPLACAPSL